MKVKIIRSYSHTGLEKYINMFLADNDGKIEVTEIQWKVFFEYSAMIVYNEKQ